MPRRRIPNEEHRRRGTYGPDRHGEIVLVGGRPLPTELSEQTQRPVVDGLAVAVYVLAATTLSYFAVQDGGGSGVAAGGLLVLAFLLGAITQRRLVYWLPFIPWVLLALAVSLSGGRTAGWNDLWFFNLAILGLLGVLAMMLARAVRRLLHLRTAWPNDGRSGSGV